MTGKTETEVAGTWSMGSKRLRALVAAFGTYYCLAGCASGQTRAPLEFEAASIKPASQERSTGLRQGGVIDPSLFREDNITLQNLISDSI